MNRLLLLLVALGGCATPTPSGGFDIVLVGGRVMDPETGLDAIRNVGILEGRIAAVTTEAIRGRETIDARGLVVAPGFIDLHSHGQDAENYGLKAADGCTTALELEVGAADIDGWYRAREGRSLINFGTSVGHIPVRMAVMGDPPGFLPDTAAKANTVPASDAAIEEIKRRLRDGLKRGAVAMGFGIQYTGAASRWEILEAFRVAAEFGASCHVHLRHNGRKEPNNSTQALEEVLAAAAVTGAPLHVVHIHSTSVAATPRHLQMISEAKARGLDVTAECYPYQAGMTKLNSGVFDGNWREALEVDYKDILWPATGERLTAETFEKYRKSDDYAIIFSIPETAVNAALVHPLVLIGSDGIWDPLKKQGHPRCAGTYARILGRYVREQKLLPLMEALRKMSLGPAQRLEHQAPMFKKKGRVQAGADADLAVFDPATVIDRSTYDDPTKVSEGFCWVLVNGVPVLRNRELLRQGPFQGGFPGRAARGPIRD
ncbi:MAG TPA: amidohydrolase family protein [Planctomycetota bacterium]|nr:amidohydrolase family protein [Planctomycetota bacterium]